LTPSYAFSHYHQSGLFSAVVTTFLISSYPALQPDVSAINANLTAQVATISARSTNQSEPVTPQLTSPNSYTAYLTINAFWFLSLAFSLICALLAILVQQWSRTYLQGTEERFNLHPRVRMRTYLQQGVQKFHFVELVGTIPV
jgi:beta-lactamase regulating signal transducer with metallopeptidase domain